MKLIVDRQLCEGNARCAETAPELFQVRDDDKSYVLVESPSPRQLDKARLAARLCPRQAISIVED